MFETAAGWVKLYKAWKPSTGRSSLPRVRSAPMQSLFVALDAVIGGPRFGHAAQATRTQPNTTIAGRGVYREGERWCQMTNARSSELRGAQDASGHNLRTAIPG